MQTSFIIVQKNKHWYIYNWRKPEVSNPNYNDMDVKVFMKKETLNCGNKITTLLSDDLLHWFISINQSTINATQKDCADSISFSL